MLGARDDCAAALDALREGLARGVAYGMDLHAADELHEVRRCDGCRALARPRG